MDYKIREVLLNKKQKFDDQVLSLNETIDDDGKTELGDSQYKNHFNNFMGDSLMQDAPESLKKTPFYDEIRQVLKEYDEQLDYDPYLTMMGRFVLILYFRKPRNRHAKELFLKKWCADYKVERLLERLLLEVRNRLMNLYREEYVS
jgi:hypothetical protein